MTSGVNRGIVELLEGDTISATALILGHPGTAEAIDIARSLPVLDLGLHINLTDGRSVTNDRRLAPYWIRVVASSVAAPGARRDNPIPGPRGRAGGGERADRNLLRVWRAADPRRQPSLRARASWGQRGHPGVRVRRGDPAHQGKPLALRRATVDCRGNRYASDRPPGGPGRGRQRHERSDPRQATDFVLPLSASRGPVPLSVLGRMLASIASRLRRDHRPSRVRG